MNSRRLKIFVPDFSEDISIKNSSIFLLPFRKKILENELIKYENIKPVFEVVDNIQTADIVVPAYNLNYYYSKNKTIDLFSINENANLAGKLTVCNSNGDWGITPKLKSFHLYRSGGYFSKNKGNEFCIPFFFSINPLADFFENKLPVHTCKTKKPVIGFCGRASDDLFNSFIDIAKNCRRKILKSIDRWHEDVDWFYGSAYKRFQMLKILENSQLVQTKFIYSKDFFGNKKDKKTAQKKYYENIKTSQYIFCYRGWGNFSIRLYEAMCCGKIPVIIDSDINLPFENKIDWRIFPVIKEKEIKNLPAILSSFHNKLSNDDFVSLQYKARNIWEEYLTYEGFMKTFAVKYISYNIALH